MTLSGFAIVRDATRLDFPIEASLGSILPLCDELVVNVGRSDDGTLERVRAMGDPRIRILETEWDFTVGEALLRTETLRAMRACRNPWGLGIQADEVLHEDGLDPLRDAIERARADDRADGVALRYRHFFGSPDLEAVNRRWYRREVRAVRLDLARGVMPFRDAQGFRVEPGHRRVRAVLCEAEIFHYGWLRSAAALRARGEVDRRLYPGRWVPPRQEAAVLRWFPGLRPVRGRHPAIVREWVESRRHDPDRVVTPPYFELEHIRFYLSDALERVLGVRPFEFRNYEPV